MDPALEALLNPWAGSQILVPSSSTAPAVATTVSSPTNGHFPVIPAVIVMASVMFTVYALTHGPK